MILTAFDVSSIANSLPLWECGEYIAEVFVIIACAGEVIPILFKKRLTEEHREVIEKYSTFLLVAALSAGLLCLIRTNVLSGMVIVSLGNQAGEAGTKAKKAVEDSTAALTKSGTALDESGKAETAAGKVTIAVENAQKKVEVATKELLELQKHIEQVRKLALPRVLSQKFEERLKGRPTGTVEIRYNPGDDEAYEFAYQMFKGFKNTGWNVSEPTPITPSNKFPINPNAPIGIQGGTSGPLCLISNPNQFMSAGENTASSAIHEALASSRENLGVIFGCSVDLDPQLPDDHFIVVVGHE